MWFLKKEQIIDEFELNIFKDCTNNRRLWTETFFEQEQIIDNV